MKKYLLDTSVLVSDPEAVLNFDDNLKIIPLVVIEELDGLKSREDEVGFNARSALRLIEEAHLNDNKAGKGKIEILYSNINFIFPGLKNTNDNFLLGIARDYKKAGEDIILVTRDINLRVKARAFGIPCEDFKKHEVKEKPIPGEIKTIYLPDDEIDIVYRNRTTGVELDNFASIDGGVVENQYFVFKSSTQKSVLAKYRKGRIYRVPDVDLVYGIKPRNSEQRVMIDALLDPEIDLVFLYGQAGSGKTLVALACAMEMIDKGTYDRMAIMKSVQPLGNDIGLLPGTFEEKIKPHLMPYFDNLELILRKNKVVKVQDLIDSGRVELSAVTFARGRSIHDRFVILDEAQNLQPHVVKTMISRMTKTSKLVISGDPSQIDNPFLSKDNNGLVFAANRLINQDNIAIVHTTKTERSRLAEQAIRLL